MVGASRAAWDATGNRLESSLPMFCYSMGYVVENAGKEKASQAPSPWQRRGAVATVRTLLRQPVGASGYRTIESGFQASSCLTSGHLAFRWYLCMRVLGRGRCAKVSCGRENTGLEGKMLKDLQGEKYSLLY